MRSLRLRVPALMFGLAALLPTAARADVELTTPDGRRVVLKDDGTWKYRDDPVAAAAPAPASSAPVAASSASAAVAAMAAVAPMAAASAPAKPEGEAVLRFVRLVDRGALCSVVLTLQNQLGYEIANVVPYLAAYRADGIVFETISISFQAIRPGGTQERSVDFSGIPCTEIARIQVSGGDRCEMGDLNKYTDVKGQCLARIRVVASDRLRFDK